MDLAVYQTFRVLQEVAVARANHVCARMQVDQCPAHSSVRWELEEAAQQLAAREKALAHLQAALTEIQWSELRIARAMFLRMLLQSAASRLARWPFDRTSAEAPRSCRFESVANFLERQELSNVEKAMTVLEAAIYVQMFPPSDSIYE